MKTQTIQRRGKKRQTPTATITAWRILGTPLIVEQIDNRFGLPRYFILAERLENGNEQIISRHRQKTAAIKAAEKQ
jgi:hypothetical protein